MWTFTIPGQPSLISTTMTSGELGLAYSMVAGAVPHTEDEISPNHCPLCRNAIAIIATMRVPVGDGTFPLEAASQLVCATPVHELKAMIGDTLTDEPPATSNRAARRAAAKPAKKVAKKAVKKTAKRT